MEECRSIRKFKPDMPSKDDLNQIIEAGLYAVNGMGKQATITIAVPVYDLLYIRVPAAVQNRLQHW